ncbi:MAG: amidase [SAR202 cluster bacterium]|nr:amidase [SAR202 cluster bacterium]|tara:strand:+ start:2581 stop:3909 length:1329 start_codon:yes stop_codon:yes gene_type:complete
MPHSEKDSTTAALPSLTTLVNELRTGKLPLAKYITESCARIQEWEPFIKALIPENDRQNRLLSEARGLEQIYPDQSARPPLYGVLVGVKDIFHTDGFITRSGSAVPPEIFAGPEAASVTALRNAGALILGKTTTTEFAYFEPSPTRNPHNLEHTPGGSSSGSAAAIAAGYCHLTMGTQTIGSVIRPAAFCGTVGFKPSAGRISTDGIVPLAPIWDQPGFFTQSVADAALSASVLCDVWNTPPENNAPLPLIGIPDDTYLSQATHEGQSSFETTLTQLKEAGYEVKRVPTFPDIEYINHIHRRSMAAEMAEIHAQAIKDHKDKYRQRTVAFIHEGQKVAKKEVEEARDNSVSLRTRLHSIMDQNEIDIWVSPSAPSYAPMGIQSTGDPVMNLPWTHSGLPTISIPTKTKLPLPIGIQCASRFRHDEQLLSWAIQLEAIVSPTI